MWNCLMLKLCGTYSNHWTLNCWSCKHMAGVLGRSLYMLHVLYCNAGQKKIPKPTFICASSRIRADTPGIRAVEWSNQIWVCVQRNILERSRNVCTSTILRAWYSCTRTERFYDDLTSPASIKLTWSSCKATGISFCPILSKFGWSRRVLIEVLNIKF